MRIEKQNDPDHDDCEDQGMMPTSVCQKFECQEWRGNVQWKPPLVKRGPYWCCSKCGASYGAHAKG